jgi:TPR repeat protein
VTRARWLASGLWLASLAACHPQRPATTSPAPAPSARAALPACRQDTALAAQILPTARLAWGAVVEQAPSRFKDVTISGGASDRLQLVVVRDALVGQVDTSGCLAPEAAQASVLPDPNAALDDRSVRGVCVAESGRVRCSSGALTALLEDGGEPNPTIFFLLAHEFAHVALGQTGADDEHVEAVPAGASEGERVAQLQQACRRDDTTLKQEQEADDIALRAASAAFQREPWRRDLAAPAAAAANFEAVYQGSIRLQKWLAITPGQGLGHSGAGRYFCEVLKDRSDDEVPFYGGGHPRRWTRLAELMQAAGNAAFGPNGREDRESAGLLGVNRLTDSLLAAAQEDMVLNFCKDVNAYEAKQLDCTHFARPVQYDATALAEKSRARDAAAPLPVTLATPAVSDAARAALENHSFLNLIQVKLFEDYKGKQHALDAQQAAARAVSALLRRLESWAAGEHAVWVYEQHSGVEARGGFGADEYSLNFELFAVLRSPRALKSSDVQTPGFSGRVEIESADWAKSPLSVILYLPERGKGQKEGPIAARDQLAVFRKPQPLDTALDFAAAAGGHPNQLAPALRELTGYAMERMVKSGRSLASPAPEPFNITLLAKLGNIFEHIEIAKSWSELRPGPTRPGGPGALAAQIERAFDYGDGSRELTAGELATLFGDDAGEGSAADKWIKLGLSYKTGDGVAKSDQRAVQFFKQACDAHSSDGCGYYAGMLILGRGTRAEPPRALALLRDACGKGSQVACARLGAVYRQGLAGEAVDGAKAETLLKKACGAKELFGCVELATLYGEGATGVEADGWLAAIYLQRACEGGMQEACTALGVLLTIGSPDDQGPHADRERARALLAKACEGRVAEACNQLGQCYMGGLFEPLDAWGEPNIPKAEPVLSRGCELGSAEACYWDAKVMVRMGLLQTDPRVQSKLKPACKGGYKRACPGHEHDE